MEGESETVETPGICFSQGVCLALAGTQINLQYINTHTHTTHAHMHARTHTQTHS